MIYIMPLFIIAAIYQLQLEVKKTNKQLSKILDHLNINDDDTKK